MAPLLQALQTRFTRKDKDTTVYSGNVDPDWTIQAIPHGGYALGLVLDAAIKNQSSTNHKDICHCTAHFVRSALPKPFEVHIRNLKIGRGFSNITANLMQDGEIRIMTHLIFTTLPETPAEPSQRKLPTPENLTIVHPSPFARLMPIEKHPSKCKDSPIYHKFTFKKRMRWSEQWDQVARAVKRRQKDGRGGAEWSGWVALVDESDEVTPSSLAFFADMFRNLPEMLPKGQKPGVSWFPTMVMAIDFKFKIPRADGRFAKRTVGLHAYGNFMQDGRHDNSVEVWTAPCELGESGAKLDTDWRKDQFCLAVSTQMALTLPISVNEKRRSKL
ncbi:hypothetical protein P389DRAFT_1031 [Cystobasidium minutum MCA 4210]|uniref:uncharacterized protein n=1 Tax=Cystobasidium minutum MCA 4210 TaxID=1397322 RepID=UPI0034CFDCDE|eukprot:jgi/Rhomi1/1031/CE1030_1587